MSRHSLTIRLLCVGVAVTSSSYITQGNGDTDFERVREAARGEIAGGTMPGMAIAVVHEGRIVFAEGFGVASVETRVPVTPDTVFQVGSVGKMLTAAAVLETAADGRLGLNDPIGRVSKGLAADIAALTPHQLLSQTSRMRDIPGNYGELGDDAHGRFLRTLTSADRILVPGQSFSYSNLGYSLAGLAVAEASGTDFATVVSKRVFEPVGMRRSTLRPTEAMTWPISMGHLKQENGSFAVVRPMAHDTRLWPAGYVFTTASDLARFATALLGEGRIDGRAVLRPETPRQMMTAHVELPSLFDGWRYGYAMFLMPMRGLPVVEHGGSMVGFAALVRTVPEQQFAVIALSNSEMPALKTVDAAMEALLPLKPSVPRPDGPPITMDATEMQRYAGRYENRGTFVLAVEQGTLTLRQNDGPALPVTKVTADRFVAAGANNQPRLRFLLRPAEGNRPATLHFSLWAYSKIAAPTR